MTLPFRCLIAPIAVVVISTSLNAAASEDATRFTIIGARAPCDEWTKSRAAHAAARRKQDFELISVLREQWLLGYLSGITYAIYASDDPLDAIDAKTIFDWMDRYCRSNPQANVATGSHELLQELAKLSRKGKKPTIQSKE